MDRRRWCSKFDIPSVGEPSGEGTMESDGGVMKEPAVDEGGVGITCSVKAVVATAFAVPLDPANGIRPPEKGEELD